MNEYSLYSIVYDLIECESNFSETVCGDSGRSCGALQFRQATWEQWDCEGTRFNLEDSIKCGVKLINAGTGHKEAGWMNCWRIETLPILARKGR